GGPGAGGSGFPGRMPWGGLLWVGASAWLILDVQAGHDVIAVTSCAQQWGEAPAEPLLLARQEPRPPDALTASGQVISGASEGRPACCRTGRPARWRRRAPCACGARDRTTVSACCAWSPRGSRSGGGPSPGS